jgi:hypothetical protein
MYFLLFFSLVVYFLGNLKQHYNYYDMIKYMRTNCGFWNTLQSNARKLRIWYIIQFVFYILTVLGTLATIFNVVTGSESAWRLVAYAISLVYRGITLNIIRKFRDEVDQGLVSSGGGVVYSTA